MVKLLYSNKHMTQTLSLQACEKQVPASICPPCLPPYMQKSDYSLWVFSERFLTSIHRSLEHLVATFSFPIKYLSFLPLSHVFSSLHREEFSLEQALYAGEWRRSVDFRHRQCELTNACLTHIKLVFILIITHCSTV